MARTIAHIEAEILAAKAAEPLLDDLNSPSNTAIWRLWIRLTAVAHYVIYRQWETTKVDFSTIMLNNIMGTLRWYALMARGVVSNGYPIVSRASARENGTKVIVKVAKLSGGILAHLTPLELSAVRKHIKLHKIAGTDIDVLSQTADLVSMAVDIRCTGDFTVVSAAVKFAIKDYMANLDFDTSLSKGLLVDMLIGTVDGVADAYIRELSVDIGFGYNVISASIVEADAGYFEIGTSGGSDLITLNLY